MAIKKALTIGINYIGTSYQLQGCLNDAEDWGNLLSKNGFEVTPILEKDATKQNIVFAITNLLQELKKDDIGVITSSSHGTWIPSKTSNEPDGRDEAICPIDMGEDGHNLIIGPEFKGMFDILNTSGAHVVFITDSCFSGHCYRWLGNTNNSIKMRFIPPAHFLKDQNLIRRMDVSFGQAHTNIEINHIKQPLPNLVHLSAGDDNEFAADALIDNRYNGAMSYYAIKAFEYTLALGGTYLDAWTLVRQSLPNYSYPQHPRLNAFSDLKNTKLLT